MAMNFFCGAFEGGYIKQFKRPCNACPIVHEKFHNH